MTERHKSDAQLNLDLLMLETMHSRGKKKTDEKRRREDGAACSQHREVALSDVKMAVQEGGQAMPSHAKTYFFWPSQSNHSRGHIACPFHFGLRFVAPHSNPFVLCSVILHKKNPNVRSVFHFSLVFMEMRTSDSTG
jgi:hypothetical protein